MLFNSMDIDSTKRRYSNKNDRDAETARIFASEN